MSEWVSVAVSSVCQLRKRNRSARCASATVTYLWGRAEASTFTWQISAWSQKPKYPICEGHVFSTTYTFVGFFTFVIPCVVNKFTLDALSKSGFDWHIPFDNVLTLRFYFTLLQRPKLFRAIIFIVLTVCTDILIRYEKYGDGTVSLIAPESHQLIRLITESTNTVILYYLFAYVFNILFSLLNDTLSNPNYIFIE
jgi:hypothetical protein